MTRTTIGGLAAAAWLAVLTAPALAAPGNDDFENARPLGDAPVMVDGTLAGATTQPGDPTGQPVDVWYSFTPTTSGPVSVEIPERQGAVYSPPKVYTGADRQDLLPVDSQNGHWLGRTRFDAVAGQTYRIAVVGWRPEGTFKLRVRPATPPSNDDFADARHVRVPGLYQGENLEEATTELGEPRSVGKYTVWYRIRPRHSSRLTLEADTANCDARVGAFTGSRLSSLHRIAERSFAVRFNAQAGRTYRVRVSCTGGYVGDYTLDVSDGSIAGKGVHMTVKPGQTLDSVRRHGLRLDVGARRKVGVSIDLGVDRRTARRLGSRDRVIGHVRGRLGYGQDAPATIRLERSARRALAHRHRLDATLRLTLLDHAPNRVLNVPVHLRRAATGA
jgi:hypothetical protein